MKICRVFYQYVMISKLSDFPLGKRPFFGDSSCKTQEKPYNDYAAQMPFAAAPLAAALLTSVGVLLSSSCIWVAVGGCQPIPL